MHPLVIIAALITIPIWIMMTIWIWRFQNNASTIQRLKKANLKFYITLVLALIFLGECIYIMLLITRIYSM